MGRGRPVITALQQQATLLVRGEPQVGKPLQQWPGTVSGGCRLRLCGLGVARQQQGYQQPGPGQGPAPPEPHQEQRHGGKHQHIATVEPGQGTVLDNHIVAVDAAIERADITVIDRDVQVAAAGRAGQLCQRAAFQRRQTGLLPLGADTDDQQLVSGLFKKAFELAGTAPAQAVGE